jgi:hypothetical protein
MKKRMFVIILACVMLIPAMVFADNTCEVNIDNPRIEGSDFKFDIQIKRTSLWTGFYAGFAENMLGSSDFLFDFNAEAFTSNPAVSYENLISGLDMSNYDIVAKILSDKLHFKVTRIEGGNLDLLIVGTEYVTLCTYVVPIDDPTKDNGIEWDVTASGIQSISSEVTVDAWNGSGDLALPVVLSSFTAAFIDNAAVASWTTQSENENSGWNVYRGETEEALTTGTAQQVNVDLIAGAGTTTTPTDYTFSDPYPVTQGFVYWYWLESVSYDGTTEHYGPISLTIPESGGSQQTPEIPVAYGLFQNHPNPFNPATAISFNLPENCEVTLDIYNTNGQRVITLLNKAMSAGSHEVTWNGQDSDNTRVSSGIYFYRLTAGTYTSVKKMMLLK